MIMSRLRVGKKLILSLSILLLSLAGAEGAVRVWLRVRGEPFDQAVHRRELEVLRKTTLGSFSGEAGDSKQRAEQPATWARTLHPYFAFDKPTGAKQLERDLAREARSGPELYTVMILGGSVAAEFGGHGRHKLKEVLAADPRFAGRYIEVLRYGVAAFKQPQQLMKLAYIFSIGLHVDAVINLDGFNEVAIANGNAKRGVNPAYPVAAEWLRIATDWTADPHSVRLADQMYSLKQRTLAVLDASLASPLRWSAIYARLQSARLARLRRDASYVHGAFVDRTRNLVPQADSSVIGPKFDNEGDAAIEFAVLTWMESSLSIHALCAMRGVEYLHVLQPALVDPGSKVATPEETAGIQIGQHWTRGVRVGYPLMRQAGRGLQERGVSFFDATGVFRDVEQTVYVDACHLHPHGYEFLAEAIGQAFLDQL